jgi:hypothetical protein
MPNPFKYFEKTKRVCDSLASFTTLTLLAFLTTLTFLDSLIT